MPKTDILAELFCNIINPLIYNVPKWSENLVANAARFLKCV